ncbi:MAG TPA: TfoX/Sxy family protein [Gammaproteobacteria bacterium]|nr:TfoX/Sxy family protein [Gammaproteobacteria bacterium]
MSEDSFTDFVLAQLHDFCQLRCRSMFGGHGLYNAGTFFGIIHSGRLYLRTNERTRARYLAAGMQSFRPNDNESLRYYYQVPADVVADTRRLVEWALDAVDGS